VRFLVDAQLPRRLAHQLAAAGHDTLHTLELPHANRTSDDEILRVAEREDRIVVTKDADFVNSFLIHRRPPTLLLVATGNVGNAEILSIFATALPQIDAAFETASFLELHRNSLVIHQ
jgi:predicted nuclease of predicted toxin-antitoxin system